MMIGALLPFRARSIGSAYRPNAAAFVAARVVLGAAGAALVVMTLSIFAVLFSEDERPRAVGVWAAANFLARPIGPILGGWLLTHSWWGWTFPMHAPVAARGAIAGATLGPDSRAPVR